MNPSTPPTPAARRTTRRRIDEWGLTPRTPPVPPPEPLSAPPSAPAPPPLAMSFFCGELEGRGRRVFSFPFFVARKVVHVDEAWDRGVKTLSVAVERASAAVDRRRHLTKGALWSVSALTTVAVEIGFCNIGFQNHIAPFFAVLTRGTASKAARDWRRC